MPADRDAVRQLRWQSVHTAGHALIGALSKHGDPVAKVTIVPAGQALGVTEQLPIEERHLYSDDYLKDSLAIRMGGEPPNRLSSGTAPPALPVI